MAITTQTLSERVRELPPAERLALVDDILGSLDETSPEIDRLWATKAHTAWCATTDHRHYGQHEELYTFTTLTTPQDG